MIGWRSRCAFSYWQTADSNQVNSWLIADGQRAFQLGELPGELPMLIIWLIADSQRAFQFGELPGELPMVIISVFRAAVFRAASWFPAGALPTFQSNDIPVFGSAIRSVERGGDRTLFAHKAFLLGFEHAQG